MHDKAHLTLVLHLVFLLPAVAAAQTARPGQPSTPTVTASATSSGVRFAAIGPVKQTRLEVYDAAGTPVFDSGFLPGNVRDFSHGSAGLADGSYAVVLTSREVSGRLSLKRAGLVLRGGEVSLALGVAEAAGEAEMETGAATLSTHDGRDGALTSTAGALTLRTGDVLRGEDREHVRVTEDGRVGIGTKKPEALLDVAGAVRASGGFKFSDGSTLDASSGRLTLRDPEGVEVPTQGAAVAAATANRLAKFSDGAGTLTDAAGAEVGGLTFLGQNNSGQVAPLFAGAEAYHVLEVGAAGTKSPLTLAGGSGAMEFWKDLGGGLANPAAAVAFGVAKPGTASTNDMVFSTYTPGAGWNERMRIATGGNVGVGTTAPRAPLDVTGNAVQDLPSNGFVKAMVLVTITQNPDASIVVSIGRCFNGVLNISTGNCGFTPTVSDVAGNWRVRVNFGFTVDNRFVSFTQLDAPGNTALQTSFGRVSFFNSTTVQALIPGSTAQVFVFVY